MILSFHYGFQVVVSKCSTTTTIMKMMLWRLPEIVCSGDDSEQTISFRPLTTLPDHRARQLSSQWPWRVAVVLVDLRLKSWTFYLFRQFLTRYCKNVVATNSISGAAWPEVAIFLSRNITIEIFLWKQIMTVGESTRWILLGREGRKKINMLLMC